MKKMAALLLALAVLGAAGGASAAGTIEIRDQTGTTLHGEITAIVMHYTDSTTETLDLSQFSGNSIILYPSAGRTIDYVLLTVNATLTILYEIDSGASTTIPAGGQDSIHLAAGETVAFFDDMRSSLLPTITLSATPAPAPKPAGGSGGPEPLLVPEKPGQEAWITSPSGPAPVYDGPGQGANVIGQAAPGSTVHLLQWSGSMCRLLYNDDRNAGWVDGAYIEVVP